MFADEGEFFDGPFDHYEATPDDIEASAVELDRSYGSVNALSNDVGSAQRPALTGVSGVLAGPMAQAPQPMRGNARQVMDAAIVAAGSVRLFGHDVQDFNGGVDQLNAEWQAAVGSDFGVAAASYPTDANALQKSRVDEARADAVLDAKIVLLKDLEAKYADLRSRLDAGADNRAAQLHEGPSDEVIQQLFAAGGLPSYVAAAFPHLKLEATTLPPDLANLSDEEIEDYLRSHPDIANAVVNPLLAKDHLTDQEQAIVEAQGRIDGELLKKAMSAPPGPDALEKIEAATARLKLINAHVAKTGELNDAAHSYTVAYVNEVGSENLAKLPSVVTASATSVHQDLDALTKTYLSPISDAILNLSNEQLQDVTGEEGPGTTTFRYDFNNDGFIDTADMPKAVRELIEMRIGEGDDGARYANGEDGTYSMNGEVKNLDAFKGWSELMASSTVDGGHGFSVDLGEQAIEAKQDMNAILANAARLTETGSLDQAGWDQLASQISDQPSSDLLSVVARNEDASSSLLLDDTHREELLGLNWDHAGGTADVIRAGTDRNPDEGGGTAYQAEAALKVMTEVASDPAEYLDRASNEELSDAIVDVGINWIDTFGENVNSDTESKFNVGDTDVLGQDLPLSVTLSDADQRAFLEFVAGTGDDDAVRLESASQYYGQQLISAALDQHDPDVLDDALEWAGRADGQIRQANVEWAFDQLQDDHAQERAELLAENRSIAATNTASKLILSVGGTIVGTAFPPAAPFISVGNALAGPTIDGVLDENPIPDYEHMELEDVNRRLEADALDSTSRRNMLLAQVAAMKGYTGDGHLYTGDGSLMSAEDIANLNSPVNGNDELEALAESVIRDWNSHHDTGDQVDIDQFDAARDDTFSSAHADNDRKDDDGWRNDSTAERRLYGDNAPEGEADPDEGTPLEWYPEDPDDLKPGWER